MECMLIAYVGGRRVISEITAHTDDRVRRVRRTLGISVAEFLKDVLDTVPAVQGSDAVIAECHIIRYMDSWESCGLGEQPLPQNTDSGRSSEVM